MIIIEIAGHLGVDPETRVTANGQKLTLLRMATNIRNGEKEETVWWHVTLWGSEFDNMVKHLKKGSALIVIGEMARAPEIYTDKNQRQQVSMKITGRILKFSPFGKTGERSGTQQQQQPFAGGYAPSAYGTQAQTETAYSQPSSFATSGLGSENHDMDEEPPPF